MSILIHTRRLIPQKDKHCTTNRSPLRDGRIPLFLAVDKVEHSPVPRGRVRLVHRVLPPPPLVYPDLRLGQHEFTCKTSKNVMTSYVNAPLRF